MSEQLYFFGKEIEPSDFLRILSVEGVSFHFGQSAEDTVLLRLFHNKLNGFYIDIGAFHPRKYSNTFLLHQFFGWSGINIDASSETISKFNKERPNDININAAVSEKPGTFTYYQYDKPARNTISKENVARQDKKGDVKVISTAKISAKPLKDILSEHIKDKQVIDLMTIDIEGMDLAALKTNDWKRYRPRVVLIEDYEVLSSPDKKSSIASYLSKQNYVLISHTFDTSFYIDGSVPVINLSDNETKGGRVLFKKGLTSLPATEHNLALLMSSLGQLTSSSPNLQSDMLEQLIKNNEQEIIDLETELMDLNIQIDDIRSKNSDILKDKKLFEDSYINIITSRAWKITAPLRNTSKVLHSIKRKTIS